MTKKNLFLDTTTEVMEVVTTDQDVIQNNASTSPLPTNPNDEISKSSEECNDIKKPEGLSKAQLLAKMTKVKLQTTPNNRRYGDKESNNLSSKNYTARRRKPIKPFRKQGEGYPISFEMKDEDKELLNFYRVRLSGLKNENMQLHSRLESLAKENIRLLQVKLPYKLLCHSIKSSLLDKL